MWQMLLISRYELRECVGLGGLLSIALRLQSSDAALCARDALLSASIQASLIRPIDSHLLAGYCNDKMHDSTSLCYSAASNAALRILIWRSAVISIG